MALMTADEYARIRKLNRITVTKPINLDQLSADLSSLETVVAGLGGGVSDGTYGDIIITGSGTVFTVGNAAISNIKLATIAQDRIKGRISAGTGVVEDLTAAQVRTLINVANGANNYVHPNHTGDVTSLGDGATTIANDAVSNSKLADMNQALIKGRAAAAGTGDPTDLTANQVSTILDSATDPFARTSALPSVPTTTDGLTQGATNLYNQTHTGEVTGATALTLDKTAISNRSSVTPVVDDVILYGDTSDSNNLKKATVSEIVSQAPEGIITLAQYFGSSVKFVAPETGPHLITTTSTLSTQVVRLMPVLINRNTTLTGIGWYQSTQGVYTGNNYNGVGLYKYDGAGNLTLVASSTNDANIWKGGTATWQTKAFSSTYAAEPGGYFMAFLFCQSALTTAPVVGACANFGAAAMSAWDFTNSAKLYSSWSAQTAFAANPAMSSYTSQANRIFAYLY